MPEQEQRGLDDTSHGQPRTRWNDPPDITVERLNFPLKVMISLLTGAIAICVFILSVTWELRSDIRDMNTKSSASEELQAERLANIREQLAGVRRMQDLQAYEIQALKLSLSEAGVKISYPKEN